ncbi:hypothetical protein [Acidiphilium acidophilum]|nr:hypothetical protein [Acidiphilium acidophilum]
MENSGQCSAMRRWFAPYDWHALASGQEGPGVGSTVAPWHCSTGH